MQNNEVFQAVEWPFVAAHDVDGNGKKEEKESVSFPLLSIDITKEEESNFVATFSVNPLHPHGHVLFVVDAAPSMAGHSIRPASVQSNLSYSFSSSLPLSCFCWLSDSRTRRRDSPKVSVYSI